MEEVLMGRKPTGNPVGRPEKPINWETFEQLCALHCTQTEICSFLHLHYETLSIRVRAHYGEEYPNVYKRFVEHGKCSLRRNQFAQTKKSSSMAIWLGKQWLEQSEFKEEELRKKLEIEFEIRKKVLELEYKMKAQGIETVPQDIKDQYHALMHQLTQLQSDRKIDDSNSNAAAKS